MKWSNIPPLEREDTVTRVRRSLTAFNIPVPRDLEVICEVVLTHTARYDHAYEEGHEAGYDLGHADGFEQGADEGYRQKERELHPSNWGGGE